MQQRDADAVIRGELLKRLRSADLPAPVAPRPPASGGQAVLPLPNGPNIRLVWTAGWRQAHRFDFSTPGAPILYLDVATPVSSVGALRPSLEALIPAFAAELRAHYCPSDDRPSTPLQRPWWRGTSALLCSLASRWKSLRAAGQLRR
jgi:hypothetical protein